MRLAEPGLRETRAPNAAARGAAHATPPIMTAPRFILVPVDGSDPSLAALEHAVALAEDGPTEIEVLHVEGPDRFAVGSSSPLSPSLRRERARRLEDAVDRARARLGSRILARSEAGDPLRTIVMVANEGGHDLIVIGTHGRVGRLHALLGSVAEGVVRNAPCPVLTVREPGRGYQSFAERRHGRPSFADQYAPRHH